MTLFYDGKKQVNEDKVNVKGPVFKRITQANTWNDILDAYNDNYLISIRDDSNNATPSNDGNLVGGNGAGIVFGGYDTHSVVSVLWDKPVARIAAGNANKFIWREDIAWKSDIQRLENKISELQKQIGGVLNSSLTHLYQAFSKLTTRKVVAY